MMPAEHASVDEPLRVGQEREEEGGAVGLARFGRDATVQEWASRSGSTGSSGS